MDPIPTAPALRMRGVSLTRGDRTILDGVDWTISPGQRWVVLGRNGSGKTTLLRIGALYLHPTSGSVEVLGATLGRIDVRAHRERIGYLSAALADQLRPSLRAVEVVVTAKHAALEPWWHSYDDSDLAHAIELLDRVGVGYASRQPFGTLSSGERQRVLLARTLFGRPGLLLLDEPMAALDLGAREELISTLESFAGDPAMPPMALVTHHVEEIAPGFTHALLLVAGRVLAAGPIDDVLRDGPLSEGFGLALRIRQAGGRWSAGAV